MAKRTTKKPRAKKDPVDEDWEECRKCAKRVAQKEAGTRSAGQPDECRLHR